MTELEVFIQYLMKHDDEVEELTEEEVRDLMKVAEGGGAAVLPGDFVQPVTEGVGAGVPPGNLVSQVIKLSDKWVDGLTTATPK